MSDLLRRLQDAQTNHDSFCFGWLGEAADRIRELEKMLHECNLDIVELAEDRNEWIAAGAAESRRVIEAAKKLADRDAAWERAIEAWWNKGRRASDSKDFLAAIREILEAEGGGT